MLLLDRAARNALTKPPSRTTTDTNVAADDEMSVCSNVSDGTSIYDDVESKALTHEEISMEEKMSFV